MERNWFQIGSKSGGISRWPDYGIGRLPQHGLLLPSIH